MISKIKNRDSASGFTIIEVLIVLAIAGLIMLIVFLAVPALQRSARNTQRKNDVAGILSGISTYVDNNGGTLPNAAGDYSMATPPTFLIGASGAQEQTKLGYYTAYAAACGTAGDVCYGTATTITTDNAEIFFAATCTNASTATTTGAGPRSFAVVYGIESNGAFASQCQAS